MARDPRARFKITADGSDYKRKLKAALNDTNRFAGSLRSALRTGALAGAAAVAATTVALVRLSSEAAKNADALAKQSDILDITTQKLAAYQLAARLSGSSNDGFEKGIRKLQKSIVDATNGLTTYTRAFDALKLDPNELKQLTPDQQFETLAKSFAGVTNQAERVSIAYDLFGGRNTALLNTLVLTGSQLNKLEQDTKAWGVAISRVDAKQIENANDAVERAKTAMQGLGTNIAIAIAPLREDLANSFADAAAESQGFKAEVQSTMEALVVGANFAANSVRGIQLAFLATRLAFLEAQRKFTAGAGGGSSPRSQKLRDVAIGVPEDERSDRLKAAIGTEDGDAVRRIIEEQDKIGRAIDEILGKFQTGEEALTRFRELQAEALAAARDAVQPPGVAPTGDGEEPVDMFGDREKEQLAQRLKAVQDSLLTETEAIRQAQLEREAIVAEAFERQLIGDEERNELRTQLAQEAADKLLAIERKRIQEQEALEKHHQDVVAQLRSRAVDTAISLLQTMGARSRAFAIAAIAIEKALAIQKILISSRVAAQAALEPPPIGLGPVAGQALAASILAAGKANAVLTGVLGVAQIASLGSGSTGAPLGTATNPVFTESGGSIEEQEPRSRIIEVHFHGSGFLAAQDLKRVLAEQFDADEIIIHGSSRQAQVIRG